LHPSWFDKGARLVVAIVIMVPMAPALAPNEDVRINCFLLGSVLRGICPLPEYFSEDPLFTYESDPQQAGLTLIERKRLDRLYFPRTKQVLITKFDMYFVFDPRLEHFTSRQFMDLYEASVEEGMPSLWAFGPSYGDICLTILNDVLPISDYDGYYHKPWRVVFRTDLEPVFTPFIKLGMEKVPGEAYGWMQPCQGAVTWADMKPFDFPWMVSWRPGPNGGLSWVCADEFNMVWWALTLETRGTNPYAIDLMTNLVLYSLGRPLVSDIQLRHNARTRLSTFRAEELGILSMLEFADKFGANTLSLSKRITDLESDVKDALNRYFEQDYTGSINLVEAVSVALTEIGNDAVRLKDQALFWVYVSEWLTVTAASTFGGVMVWTLMVRRRMYRAVKVTRIRPGY